MDKKNYVLGYYKKRNKEKSYYDVKANSIIEIRKIAWHEVRKADVDTVGAIRKRLGMKYYKDPKLPADAKVVQVMRDGFKKISVIGVVVLIPGGGTWYAKKAKDGKPVFYPLNYDGKIERKPVKKVW